MSRARKLLEISGRERRLFLKAVLLHLWVGLLLKVIPFRWIPWLFSSPQSPVHSGQSATYATSYVKLRMSKKAAVAGSSLQSEDVVLIQGAIQRAGSVSPWKNRCLVSSLAGRCMLRRRRILSQVSLGVAKSVSGKTVAHAWLSSGEYEIVAKNGDFHELYIF